MKGKKNCHMKKRRALPLEKSITIKKSFTINKSITFKIVLSLEKCYHLKEY